MKGGGLGTAVTGFMAGIITLVVTLLATFQQTARTETVIILLFLGSALTIINLFLIRRHYCHFRGKKQ